MRRFRRFPLLVLALAAGGGLGTWLLTDLEPLRVLLPLTVCGLLGEGFCQIDQRIWGKRNLHHKRAPSRMDGARAAF